MFGLICQDSMSTDCFYAILQWKTGDLQSTAGGTAMAKDVIMSIDSGTQSCRAFVWDKRGNVLSEGKAEHTINTPRLGWFEQDANTWWPAACSAIRQALEKTDPGKITSLCISHQRETFVPVDRDCKPLYPALPHLDMRCEEQVQRVVDELGGEEVQRITGRYPSYVCSLYKILWIIENEPHIANRVYKYMDVQGFLLRHLIGEWVTPDISADPLSLIDIRTRSWSIELLNALNLKRDQFLDLCAPGEIVGRVTTSASRETGLPEGLPIVAGAGDGICAALGTRTIIPERIFYYIGTWTVLGGFSDTYVVDRAFRTLLGVNPGTYHLESNVAGGYIVSWFLEKLSKENLSEKDWEKIIFEIPPGSEGLMTIPYWVGALSPYWDNCSRGATIGWSGIHTPAHMYRSILEGVALEHRMLLEAMAAAVGRTYKRVTFVGGGAKSPLWGQITSDVFGLPIDGTSTVESSGLGAAIIGAACMGMYPSLRDAAENMTSLEERYRPDQRNTPVYNRLFEVYKGLFPHLRDDMHRVNEIIRDTGTTEE
jgi:sugar (pentulose or hexulose) kinase